MVITNQIFEHFRKEEKKKQKWIKHLKKNGYIVIKKRNYLEFLNENYFKEKGFIKIESKMNKLKIDKPRQYRSRQGRSDAKYSETMKATAISIIGLVLTFLYILYDSIV